MARLECDSKLVTSNLYLDFSLISIVTNSVSLPIKGFLSPEEKLQATCCR